MYTDDDNDERLEEPMARVPYRNSDTFVFRANLQFNKR